MKQTSYEDLTQDQKALLDKASKAMETAYNPYSKFFVGAAVLTKEGDIIIGSNVENSAYGSTICAERSALVNANAKGKRNITKMAIIARGENFDTKTITGPCGSCRQMIFEASQVANEDIEIILSTTKKDKILLTTINELLPLAFGPKDIGIDTSKYL